MIAFVRSGKKKNYTLNSITNNRVVKLIEKVALIFKFIFNINQLKYIYYRYYL
jgi:hypothetical protein